MPEFAAPAWLLLLGAVPVIAWLRLRGGVAEAPLRRHAGTALRCLTMGALIVAIAGPLSADHARHTDVILALDRSHSLDNEAAARSLAFARQALAERPQAARVGLLVFGADAAVEALPASTPGPDHDFTSHVERSGTNIGRAIETAAAAFGDASQRRLVLLSDGRENQGDARAAAAVARSIGIPIDTIVQHQAASTTEVSVTGITVPERVHVHEPFRIGVSINSQRGGRAHLLLLRNGALVQERDVELTPGINASVFVDQAERGGLHEYEAVVNADVDGNPENNRYQAFVQVAGAPRVLHAVGEDGRGEALGSALDAQGFSVDEVPASAIPATMHRLADYDLVILDNVSGFDLSAAKMALLESYVRDGGGGVLMLGGDRSYAAGGYYGTAVERLLPVAMDVKTSVKIPSLAVIFVLDRSGSMGSRSQGEEKITIAKNAALSSIDLLNPLDRVGILAFDDSPEWIITPTEVGNRRPINEGLQSLGAGGSTDLVSALDEAVRVMEAQQAKVRHLIVLSDGLTGSDSDYGPFADRIQAASITVSTVALGLDADRSLMADLASVGGGRFYATDDPQNVPRIFTSETMVVSRNLVVERPTTPQLVQGGPLLEGFEDDRFPQLDGYQRAFAKPAAQVLLATADGDPLLVTWRFGLGKAIAFTSDLGGRWGHRWVAWQEFPRLLAQLARWTMRRSGSETLNPRFRWRDGRGEMVVDVLDRDERFINGLALQAAVLLPDRSSREVALQQVAPGRYQAHFPVPREGRYYVTLSGRVDGAAGDDEGVRVGPKTFGLAVPYSSEYLDEGADPELMEDIAAATGGRVLPMNAAGIAAILEPAATPVRGHLRIWQPLLLAALLLLVIEVAVRKVALPQAWLDRFSRSAARHAQAEAQAEPGYEELRLQIEQSRARHLRALRDGGADASGDSAARARLYLSSRRHARR